MLSAQFYLIFMRVKSGVIHAAAGTGDDLVRPESLKEKEGNILFELYSKYR